MKRGALLIILSLSLSSLPSWGQDNPSPRAQELANRKVEASQVQMNRARQNYLMTVHKFGEASSQAKAAKEKLDAARTHWRANLTERRKLRHGP